MNTTLTTAFAAAGIGIGALAVGSAALAQDDGSSDDDTTVEAPAEPADDGLEPIADSGEGRRGGPAGLVGGEGRGGRCGGGSLSTAAETIGMDVEELEAAVESGQSIADVATSNGVDPQAVVDAMVDHHSERVADKVEAGELTEEEAAEKLAEKVERATAEVNGESDDDS
jgi:hypothetical protein